MSQLMEQEGGSGQLSDEKLASLLKRTVVEDFREKDNHTLSSLCDTKRRLKRKKTPEYRRINRYYKSISQYKKEKARRKQIYHLYHLKSWTQKNIAAKLHVSISTVKRDLRKMQKYITAQLNRLKWNFDDEQRRKQELETAGMNSSEKLDYLMKEWAKWHHILTPRKYRSHYCIIHLDLTNLSEYGTPKITFEPKRVGKHDVAFPHTIAIQITQRHEDKVYRTQLGTITLTQSQRGWF